MEIYQMILIISLTLVIFLFWVYLNNRKLSLDIRKQQEDDDYVSTKFIEKSKAGIRLRALKKIIPSTWHDIGYYKHDKKILSNKTYGAPIDYISVHDTTQQEFEEKYKNTYTPCMILGMADDWPAMKTWSFENFNERFSNDKFTLANGEEKRIRYKYFYHYMNHKKHRRDDIPLYLFDSNFGDEKRASRVLLDDYDVHEWFNEDFLAILGEDHRPPFRWLIAGPKRSGCSLHIDPLGTSAWNTLIVGKKRWVMFPPHTFKSEKELKTDPGASWFINEYPKYKDKFHIDVIQESGETLFLPSGWWHVTMNLQDSIAITQNFVTDANVKETQRTMINKRPKTYFKWVKLMGDRIQEDRTFDDVAYSSDVYSSSDSESD
jgi:histone arginine demethylase JMJD6